MMQIRVADLVCAVAGSLMAFAGAVQAQTATPTLTPVPTPSCTPRSMPRACLGAKVVVAWFAKDPNNARVSISATNCPLVPRCLAGLASGTLASLPPIAVKLTDSGNNVLSKVLTAPGQNHGGCPGGRDTYRDSDRLSLVYGTAMTVIASVKIPLLSPTPPAPTPPVAVTVNDACGAIVNATTTTCFAKASSIGTTVKCIAGP